MDTMCAKIVTDLTGKDHILIEGRVIELVGDADQVNPVVEAVVRALRNAKLEASSIMAQANCAMQAAGLIQDPPYET